MPTTPTLTGQRIRLEPLTLDHLPALEPVAFDHDHWKYGSNWVNTPAELRAWAEHALKLTADGIAMCWITTLLDGTPIGSTRFSDLSMPHRTVELGFTWLTAPWRGTGVNTEAKLLQLTYGFEQLNLRRIGLKINSANARSRAAILKLGAKEEGTLRNHQILPDGSSRDTTWFSITDEEWPEIKFRLQNRLDKSSNA